MSFAATVVTPTSGTLDDQVAARLLHQRIIVLGVEVDEQTVEQGESGRGRSIRGAYEERSDGDQEDEHREQRE